MCDDAYYIYENDIDEINPFLPTAVKVAGVVQEKDKQYGDAYGKVASIISIMYPAGIPLQQYSNALYIMRILEKLCRISTGLADLEDPDLDIIGYTLKRIVKRQNENKQLQSKG